MTASPSAPLLMSVTSAGTAPCLDVGTRFLFFTGKGGVGKTTVASATALRLVEAHRRVLIVSTEPASNLDDVFAMRAGAEPTAVPGAPGLWVMNLDPVAAAAVYRERVVSPYRGVLPESAVRSMEEQLSGSITAAGRAGQHAFARVRNLNPHAVALVVSFLLAYNARSEGGPPAGIWPIQLGAAGTDKAEQVIMRNRPWAREATVHAVERF
jgi:hypothetical protein